MRCGVQASENVGKEAVNNAGLSYIELRYDAKKGQISKVNDGVEIKSEAEKDSEKDEPAKGSVKISGIELQGKNLTSDELVSGLHMAKDLGAEYVLINTDNIMDEQELLDVFDGAMDAIMGTSKASDEGYKAKILIQNGCFGDDINGYKYSAFSDTKSIKNAVEYGNRLSGADTFAVAIDVGRGNLLEKNIPMLIMELKEYVYLLHVNDNDGRKNLEQMPFTFTTGRGSWSTDWNRIWSAFSKCEGLEWIIFNTNGLFNRVSVNLAESMLKLEKAVFDRWIEQMHFEDKLKGRKIVLFGSGAMADNYLKVWGAKYRPEFIVDNNESRWGKQLKDVEIKSPEAIKEIPEEERLVLICNRYYNEVKIQLTGMGVSCESYNDELYCF